MTPRDLKDPLYAQFARVGAALASPKRLELLELLSQSEKRVEVLAEQAGMPLKNTSAHLRALREARLVEYRRDGAFIYYRLAGHEVAELLRALQAVARQRLAEIDQVSRLYFGRRDALAPVTRQELKHLLRDGLVTVVDARPLDEYEAGHIPGALSVPVAELRRRLAEIPKGREVIAYCRGPYCVYAVEMVTMLRKHGYQARRSEVGVTDWRAGGRPVEVGSGRTVAQPA